MAVYQGDEARELVQTATQVFFDFVNACIERNVISVDFGRGRRQLLIDVLFVGDLKIVPTVFGMKHAGATQFCPFCMVTREEHALGPSIGERRNLDNVEPGRARLLQIPLENIVCPPLHMIQGAVNKILERMNVEK